MIKPKHGLLLGTGISFVALVGWVIHRAVTRVTVRGQLSSVWRYISGCGTYADNKVVWVSREGKWLPYDAMAKPPTDEVGYFRVSDKISLYATEPCTLDWREYHYELVEGWNEIHWGIVGPPTTSSPPEEAREEAGEEARWF